MSANEDMAARPSTNTDVVPRPSENEDMAARPSAEAMAEALDEILLRRTPLALRTTFGVGGSASRFFRPRNVDDIARVVRMARGEGREPFILGGGSNTLMPDGIVERIILATEAMRRYRFVPGGVVAEAGVPLPVLVKASVEAGLEGLEVLAGIPGSVGGAVAMNAGGRLGAIGSLVRRLRFVDREGSVGECPGEAVEWGYRQAGLQGLSIVEVELRLHDAGAGRREALRRRARGILEEKRQAQPLGQRSAGCVFRNPPGSSAGELIERARLKGFRIGGARVSEVHGNFIVNDGGAQASDVLALIRHVRESVLRAFGVHLDLEIVVLEEGDRR